MWVHAIVTTWHRGGAFVVLNLGEFEFKCPNGPTQFLLIQSIYVDKNFFKYYQCKAKNFVYFACNVVAYEVTNL